MPTVQVPLRLPDDLHRLARIAAAARGQSLNAWALVALRAAILRQATRKDGAALAAELGRLAATPGS